MIFIALLIHLLGHYFPAWVGRNKLKEVRKQNSWKNVFIEMSGVFSNFIIAFIIIISLDLTTNEKYLLNENAIYGVKCSSVVKEIGFNDGDKFISVNNKKIIRFSEIVRMIILQDGNTFVKIQRNDKEIIVDIPDSNKLKLMKANQDMLISPKVTPDSTLNIKPKQLVYSESKKGLLASLKSFVVTVKMSKKLIFPYGKGGFTNINKVKSIKGWLFFIALFSILIGILNLLPIPGLDLGNSIIAVIEKIRKRKFNIRVLKIIKITCITTLVVIIVLKMFLF